MHRGKTTNFYLSMCRVELAILLARKFCLAILVYAYKHFTNIRINAMNKKKPIPDINIFSNSFILHSLLNNNWMNYNIKNHHKATVNHTIRSRLFIK